MNDDNLFKIHKVQENLIPRKNFPSLPMPDYIKFRQQSRKTKQKSTKIYPKYVSYINAREVTIEYYRWRKTDAYQKWFKKQISIQNYHCYYCLQSLKGKRINVEHVIPRSRGGDNNPKNLVLACATCNKDKGSTLYSGTKRRRIRAKFYNERRAIRKAYFAAEEWTNEQLDWLKP